ncbi:MAG: T9SS type A sorting domain-containing protein, partial [Melioribacteraceae bacterium]
LKVGGIYIHGEQVNLTATANTGYTFTNWTENGTAVSSNANYSFSASTNRNLIANFSQNQYIITATVNPSSGGTITGLKVGGIYNHGEQVNLTATANTGYTFTNWTENGTEVSTNANYSFSATANRNLIANFITTKYALNFTKSGNGDGQIKVNGITHNLPYSESFDYNVVVNFEAVAAVGSNFSSWSGNKTGTQNPTTITMNSVKNVTANFTLIKYALSIASGGNGNGTIKVNSVSKTLPYSGTFDFNTIVNIEAVSSIGSEFNSWTGAINTTANPTTITMSGDQNVIANYTLIQYPLNISSVGTGSGKVKVNNLTHDLPYSANFNYNTVVNIEAVPITGSTFSGWTGDLNSLVNPTTITMNGQKNINANFTLSQYSLNLTKSGTGEGQVKVNNVLKNLPYLENFNYNEIVTVEAVPTFGSVFSNWTGDLTGNLNPNTITINTAKNVGVNFTLSQYTLSVVSGGSGSGQIKVNSVVNNLPYTGSFSYNSVVNLEAVPSTNSVFSEWNGDLTGSINPNTLTIDKNKSVTSKFTKTYSLTTSVDPTTGGSITGLAPNGIYLDGTTATLTAVPANEYDFVGWSGASNSTNTTISIVMNSNQTVTANFIIRKYTLSFAKGGTGSGKIKIQGTIHDLPYSESFNFGTSVNIEAVPEKGSSFTSWSGDKTSSENPTTIVANRNKNVTVNFTLKKFDITVNKTPSEGGSVSGAGSFSYGTQTSISAIPSIEYKFVNWTENGNTISTDSNYTFIVDTSHVYIGNFTKKIYQINVSVLPEAGGSVTGGNSYTHGESVTVIATANSNNGYDFINWTENGTEVSTNPTFTFIANKNRTLVANFRLRTYNIGLSVFPVNSGTVSGASIYTHGQTVIVQATPTSGWLFVNWTENNVNVSNNSSYSFTANKNRNLIANFSKDVYSISAVPSPIEGGSISGTGSFYYGQIATLIAAANPGWTFLNWTKNGTIVSTDSSYIFTVNSTESLIANFKLADYLINCSSEPSEAGFTSGCGIARYNQTMIVKAEPNNGWKFLNWTENGDTVSTEIDYEFTVKKSRNIIANFGLVTGIQMDESNIIPENFYLSNAYPNPFNPETNIKFGLPEQSTVNLIIVDVTGRVVETVIDNIFLPAGNYTNHINGSNLASGIYFFVITAQSNISDRNFRKSGKFILLK